MMGTGSEVSSLAKSEAATRVLQDVIDRVGANSKEGVGILGRKIDVLIPGIPFWAYRAMSQAWIALESEQDEYIGLGREKLHRALDLTKKLGPTGELCLACVRADGEDEASPADLQLVNGVSWEPVPICRNCENPARKIWGLEGVAELEPLTTVWPPWSIAPTWSNRQTDVFSHERFGYAAWQKALEGDVDGMYLVGMCYELGMGLQRSVEAAQYWYKLAEQSGYPGAASGVQRCVRKGPWEQENQEQTAWWKH